MALRINPPRFLPSSLGSHVTRACGKEAGNENMNESKLQGGFGPRAVSLSIPGRKEAVRTRLAFVVVVGSKLGSAQAA